MVGRSSDTAQPGEAVPATVHKTVLKFLQDGLKNMQNPPNLSYGKVAKTEKDDKLFWYR